MKPYSVRLARRLNDCNQILLEWKKQCNGYQLLDSIQTFALKLMAVLGEYEKFLELHRGLPEEEKLLEFYFRIYQFLDIYDRVDEHYVIYCEQVNAQSFRIKL